MNRHYFIAILLLCLSHSAAGEPGSVDELSLDDAITMLDENFDTFSQKYALKTLDPTGSGCLEALVYLAQNSVPEYPELLENYRDIAEGYRFLKSNSALLSPDARETSMMVIKTKHEKLCSTIKYISLLVYKGKVRY